MSIPNKWELLPCMILQIAENWHKTIFNLGLKASITSLVQIVMKISGLGISFPKKLCICESYKYVLSHFEQLHIYLT